MKIYKKESIYCFLLGLFIFFLQNPLFAANPIPVDEAFQISATALNQNTILTHWKIAPGYHLYRDRFCFKMLSPIAKPLSNFILPPGLPKENHLLGKYEVYNNTVDIEVPLQAIKGDKVDLLVCYQGCSDENFCYPPVTKELSINLKQIGSTVTGQDASPVSPTPEISEQDKVTELLKNHSLFWVLLSFFGFGFLLSFTPCVLPMIPILSSLIIGQKQKVTSTKAFLLSLTYVLGMAITYAIAGVIAGLAGQSVQSFLQNPWAISIFSLIFVLLALSLFGLYELKLPHTWQDKITALTNKQKGGSYISVGLMGILSTLIVSPCVTAPLIGALAYIGNTGNALLGSAALFMLGLGMGLPLLIIGTSHGSLLPRAGHWMEIIKSLFGILMIAMAIWMMSRILPPQITILLWASLLIISSMYLGLFDHPDSNWRRFWKGMSLILVIYGIILIVGAAMGNTQLLKPLASFNNGANTVDIKPVVFQTIKTVDDLKKELAKAEQEHKITMLDFYAEWCISCKEMAYKTFMNPEVAEALKSFHVLQADITNQDKMDKALEKSLGVIAPPAILFFDEHGNEIKSARIVGEMTPQAFLQHLKTLTSGENKAVGFLDLIKAKNS